ncbi:MAG: hypothetical protein FD164_111 [Nitrospirae bacterium]|nr:MAG: hypothetical protein FD164_111 [Nitrospirota bacterium]
MRVLMHICCANCALYPLSVFDDRAVSVTGFWWNPNIHPFLEYRSRLAAVKQLAALRRLSVEYDDTYGLVEFLRHVAGREEDRCSYCYRIRLEATALRARELGLDGFTTSLLVSPYQKFDTIQEMGRALQERHDIAFLDEDFRPGYRKGMQMSRELGLYRQKYCGCVYSEMQRYEESLQGQEPRG